MLWDDAGSLIELNFDGTFHDPANSRYSLLGHGFFPEINSHREQLWIHQDMVNSLLNDLDDEHFFPLEVDNIATKEFMAAFPELVDYYGDNMTCSLALSLSPRNEGTPFTFSQADGILVGANKDLLIDFDLLVSNETVKKDNAIKF